MTISSTQFVRPSSTKIDSQESRPGCLKNSRLLRSCRRRRACERGRRPMSYAPENRENRRCKLVARVVGARQLHQEASQVRYITSRGSRNPHITCLSRISEVRCHREQLVTPLLCPLAALSAAQVPAPSSPISNSLSAEISPHQKKHASAGIRA